MDGDVIRRVEFFIILICKVIRCILFRFISGRIHHLIQIPGVGNLFPRDEGIELCFRAFHFPQQDLCRLLCAPHIPMTVQMVIQLFLGIRQYLKQIDISDVLLLHLLFKQLSVPLRSRCIARWHLTAIYRIFIRCDRKVKIHTVLFAVLLHQPQHTSGSIALTSCKKLCSGIILKRTFVEQPTVLSQQHAAAIQRLERCSGKLVIQSDHFMTKAEMIRKIIRKLIQNIDVEASIFFP